MITYRIAIYMGYLFSLFATILFLINYKKLNQSLKIFSAFLGLLTAVNIIGGILGSIYKMPNVFLWHYFNYIELFFMSWFFLNFYEKKLKPTVLVAAIAVFLSMLYGSLFINKITEFNILGFFSLKLFLIVLSMIEVYKSQLVSTKHYYYLNIGTIVISVVNVCFFTFWNLRLTELFTFRGTLILNITNSLAFIVGILFYIIEFYKSKLWVKNQ